MRQPTTFCTIYHFEVARCEYQVNRIGLAFEVVRVDLDEPELVIEFAPNEYEYWAINMKSGWTGYLEAAGKEEWVWHWYKGPLKTRRVLHGSLEDAIRSVALLILNP